MFARFQGHGSTPRALRLLLFTTPLLLACSVPVFRYALERWPSDPYLVTVFHKGPLAPADKKLVGWLKDCGATAGRLSGFVLRTVDLSVDAAPDAPKRPEGVADDKLPWMVVHYPRSSRIPIPAWAGPLTSSAGKALASSPVRDEMAKRLLGGDAAVWILLESGVRKQDDEAARVLQEGLKKVAKLLKLPTLADDDPADQPPEGVERPALRMSFPMLRVSRTDPAERMLVEMLIHTEEDLATLKEPMAFPVYGRGRALFALVGKGINEDNIGEACAFLVGPCACEVKAMSPGTDLLMVVNWDELLEGEITSAPALASLPELVLPVSPEAPAQPQPTTTAPAESAQPTTTSTPERVPRALVRNVAVAIVIGLAIAAAAAFVLARGSRQTRS